MTTEIAPIKNSRMFVTVLSMNNARRCKREAQNQRWYDNRSSSNFFHERLHEASPYNDLYVFIVARLPADASGFVQLDVSQYEVHYGIRSHRYDQTNDGIEDSIFGAGDCTLVAVRWSVTNAADNNHQYRYGTGQKDDDIADTFESTGHGPGPMRTAATGPAARPCTTRAFTCGLFRGGLCGSRCRKANAGS